MEYNSSIFRYMAYNEDANGVILMKDNTRGSLILILCSFIWGMAFTAQSAAAETIEPVTFVFFRFIISSAVLLAVWPLLRRRSGDARPIEVKRYLGLGSVLGVLLFGACALQQVGISYTTAANSGFITALYIVMIPIISIFLGKKVGRLVWLGVAVALAGMFLLCIGPEFAVNIGDVITLGCAFVFSFHIMTIDRYAGDMDSVLLSAIQFGVCAIVALPFMLLTEKVMLRDVVSCWTSIGYASIFSGCMGYTLQMIGQKYTSPTLASLLMCLESVFAAVGGWLLLGQTLSGRELLGCALMLSASVIAQLPEKGSSPTA